MSCGLIWSQAGCRQCCFPFELEIQHVRQGHARVRECPLRVERGRLKNISPRQLPPGRRKAHQDRSACARRPVVDLRISTGDIVEQVSQIELSEVKEGARAKVMRMRVRTAGGLEGRMLSWIYF